MTRATELRGAAATRARAGAFAVLLVAAAGLSGCAGGSETYANPYGPGKPIPLPNMPGGGLWNPIPIRPTGLGSATLLARIPGPDWQRTTTRADETPELASPEEVARREAELAAARNAPSSMDARLRRSRVAPGSETR
ncbi:MAG: hypothetical protein WCH83_05340 [Alphaproteobacteria bacterium]